MKKRAEHCRSGGVRSLALRTQSNILQTLRGAEARSRVAGILSRESFASRQSLGRRVCEEFALVDALGRWQVSGCLKALRTLAASAPEIVLPPPRVPPPDRTPRQLDEAVPAPVGVPGRVSEIEGLEVVPVTTVAQRTVWNPRIAHEHPHGLTTFAGPQVRYRVTSGHGILGAAGFSAAALQVQARDGWIGWSAPQRRDHLHRVIGLSRFLIRPAVRCPHLASQVLGRLLRRLPADLEARYGLRVWRVESYADAGVQGTCLRAANFVCVGATKGRGRQDRYHRREKTGKTVWMYPLHRRWRRDLGVAEVERWPSLAPGEGLRAQEWAANELGGAPLGDRRRTARRVKSASLLAEDPGQKIQAHPDRSRTVIRAFYRLIEQPADSAITADHILAPHRERTLQRIRGQRTVLAIQDGSDLNFARRPGCDGLQVIGTNQTRASTLGLHLHATLAVTDTFQ